MAEPGEAVPWRTELVRGAMDLLELTFRAVDEQADPDVALRLDEIAHHILTLAPTDGVPERARPELHRCVSEILHVLMHYACTLGHTHPAETAHRPRRPGVN